MKVERTAFGTGTFVAAVLSFGVASAMAQAPDNPLDKFGYKPTVEGVRQCLAQFSPTTDQAKRVKELIAQLGDAKFTVREEAHNELAKLPVLPRGELKKAAEGGDPEIKARVKQLLESRSVEHAGRILHAALTTVHKHKLKGLAPDILQAIEGHDGVFWQALDEALETTATADDVKLLKETLEKKTPGLRIAATRTLSKIAGDDQAAVFVPLLKDEDERVVLTAARALADRGDRACLPALVKLLDSSKAGVRLSAMQALRFLSGKKFGFRVSDEADARKPAIAAWKKWVESEGKTAKLAFPVESTGQIALFNGVDLSGWKFVRSGKVAPDKDAASVWKAEEGMLRLGAHGGDAVLAGYLRTDKKYTDYRLSLEYRWPEGSAGGDSGIHVIQTEDGGYPRCLEIQTHTGNAGDFYALGGFRNEGGGALKTGVGSRLKESSEKPIGEWNKVEVEVLRGVVTVKVNDVLQNKAEGLPKVPGYIAVRMEGQAFDMQNILLTPLGE